MKISNDGREWVLELHEIELLQECIRYTSQRLGGLTYQCLRNDVNCAANAARAAIDEPSGKGANI